jgi:hypothetical protein
MTAQTAEPATPPFSPEAVERAAQALRRHMGGHPDDNWTEEVLIVITALKGES